MSPKVAIHHYPGDFSDRFIEYCEQHSIEYSLVNCHDNNIIQQLEGYDIILWPWSLGRFETLQFAKELIFSLEKMGKLVYPNFDTCFFYDNKVGQKYLLEAIKAPYIETNVFYTKQEALEWINKTKYPQVFKLSGGAGSMNVKLCHSKEEANSFCNQAFGKGFSQVDRIGLFQDSLKKITEKKNKNNAIKLAKSTARLFVPTEKEKGMSREKGYLYFQEFIPKNDFDLRVVLLGNKAIGLKRLCRPDDFRASGSGKIIYDKNEIDINCIKLAFEANEKLKFQSIAFDFIYDQDGKAKIVEVSYHFSTYAYDDCQGFWDKELNWHDEKINPQFMIMDSLIEDYYKK